MNSTPCCAIPTEHVPGKGYAGKNSREARKRRSPSPDFPKDYPEPPHAVEKNPPPPAFPEDGSEPYEVVRFAGVRRKEETKLFKDLFKALAYLRKSRGKAVLNRRVDSKKLAFFVPWGSSLGDFRKQVEKENKGEQHD